MSEQTSDSSKRKARRRGPLNIMGIKRGIVLVSGFFTALVSVITGLGAQMAFAPMLIWMLGFSAEKSQGTALRYAVFAALTGLLGALFLQRGLLTTLPDGLPLFLGATFGAVLAAKATPAPTNFSARRIFQTIGVGVTLFVIVQAGQRSLFGPTAGFRGSTFPTLLLFGAVTGAISQSMTLPSGLLLIPALTFWGGYHAVQAILLSLVVVLLAGLLPAWSYGRRGLSDRFYGDAAILGGLPGGFLGGILLLKLGGGEHGDRVVLTLMAAVAMFLCGRELARLMTADGKKS